MRLSSRYILREHLGPLVFSLSALTSLLLLNYIAKQLPQLVGKGLAWDVIAEFILLSVPFTVAMTLPMAVLVATLHAFSRLAADSEITAFKASGLALPRLMFPVIVAGLVLSAVMVWFNDQVMPRANYRLATLSNDIARKKPTFALRPQVINEVVSQNLFLRAGHIDAASNELRQVDIYDIADQGHRRTIRADSGFLAFSGDGRDLLLTLYHGSMTEFSNQDPSRLQRVFFSSERYRVRNVANDLERNTVGGEKSDREMTVCELQRRMERTARDRDSALMLLSRVDARAARALDRGRLKAGTGVLYCRAIPALLAVRHAQAAVRALQQAGRTLPETTPPSEQASPVIAEGLKLQVANAQGSIDGYEVEIEKKFAIATACVIFVLLGAPIAVRFPRGGVGLTIGVSLTVFGLYYCGLLGGEALARRGYLPPYVAMWGANALFLVLGAWLTIRLGHEGATASGSETAEMLARLRDRLLRRREAAA